MHYGDIPPTILACQRKAIVCHISTIDPQSVPHYRILERLGDSGKGVGLSESPVKATAPGSARVSRRTDG
jgi:hypothetical protein